MVLFPASSNFRNLEFTLAHRARSIVHARRTKTSRRQPRGRAGASRETPRETLGAISSHERFRRRISRTARSRPFAAPQPRDPNTGASKESPSSTSSTARACRSRRSRRCRTAQSCGWSGRRRPGTTPARGPRGRRIASTPGLPSSVAPRSRRAVNGALERRTAPWGGVAGGRQALRGGAHSGEPPRTRGRDATGTEREILEDGSPRRRGHGLIVRAGSRDAPRTSRVVAAAASTQSRTDRRGRGQSPAKPQARSSRRPSSRVSSRWTRTVTRLNTRSAT